VALLAAFVGIVVGVTRRRVRRAPPYTVPQEPDVPDSRSVPLKTLQLIDLEQTAKILAGIGLFLYILGLMNVNGYLFTFGVTDFSLIRTRFIYTGALIASSAFICGLPLVLGPFRRELKTAIEKTLHGLRESEAKKAAGKGSFHRWKYRALRVTARLILVTVWSMAAALIVLTPPVLLYGLYLSQFSTSDIETCNPRTHEHDAHNSSHVGGLPGIYGWLPERLAHWKSNAEGKKENRQSQGR
jgi:hypothetical protein